MFFFFRFRKKLRSRGKEVDYRSTYATMRHPPSNRSTEFGYDPPEYEIEDNSSYRGSRRKLESATGSAAATRTMIQDRRRKDVFEFDRNMESMHKFSKSSRDVYYQSTDKEHFKKFDTFDDEPPQPRQTVSSGGGGGSSGGGVTGGNNKFNFDEQGFESDFNSPINNGGKSLRFSNDFSEKDPQQRMQSAVQQHTHQQNSSINNSQLAGGQSTQPVTSHKLRFDDNIIVSKFEPATDDMFEDDDFSKAEFSFENDDQWNAQLPKKNLKIMTNKRDENITKSESINIFVKTQDDPFEDDDFFKAASPDAINPNNNNNHNIRKNGKTGNHGGSGGGSATNSDNFAWEKNFAKFDENI